MADLSKIKAPDGTEVDIKDATARSGLADKMDKADPTGTGSLSMNRKSSTTVGSYSTTLGYYGTASGNYSTSLGNRTKAQGAESVAEGYSSTASGSDSHAEGYSTTASGASAHSEGSSTTASGNQSHAEGSGCTAAGKYSHAEGKGSSTASSAESAHAEGDNTTASGVRSHSEGWNTEASGSSSHVEGLGTIASGAEQHVSGRYNIADAGNYAEIIGNGANIDTRSNARTLDWDGNEWIAGGFKCNGMEASSSAVKLINQEKWRDAIFDCTPNGSAKDRLLSRLTKGSSNIQVLEYGGYFGGSQNKRFKITFPSAGYGKYNVFIHMESNLTQLDYEMFLAQNSAGNAFERAAYGKTTPSWTNMAGTAATGDLTWTANGLQIYSSIFAPYGGWYVKIIAHDGPASDIPNVYYTNES